jgi:proteasome lid subunit RPN8/RPN11
MLEQVRAALPREASGLLVGESCARATALSVYGTRSDENTPVSFRIRDEAIRNIEESLCGTGVRVRGCFHSHVLGAARPSRYDRDGARAAGELWLIYSVRRRELRLYEWDGKTFQKRRFRISV